MKRHTLALIGLFAFCLTAAAGVVAEPQAWVVRFPSPGGVMDLHVPVAEGKAVAGFATETDRGPHWEADVTGLKATDAGGLAGEVKLTPQPDITAAAGKPTVPATTALTLAVVAKDGRLSGTVAKPPGDKTTTGLLGRSTAPVAVYGRVMPAAAADALIELMPAGISTTGTVGKALFDVKSSDGFLLRLHLTRGKVTGAELILCTGPHDSMVAPEQAVTVEGCALTGQRLAGTLDLSAEGLQGRLTLDGTVIGSHAAGTATWADRGGEPIRTGFRAWVSRAKVHAPAQTSERAWPAQGVATEADAALAAQATREALALVRPGVSGQQPFYSTKPVHLGNYNTGDGGFANVLAGFASDCCQVARWTDDPLERDEALLQGLMAAQDPITGAIPLTGERTQKGAIKGHPDIGIAAEALATVPKLLGEPKASDKKAK